MMPKNKKEGWKTVIRQVRATDSITVYLDCGHTIDRPAIDPYDVYEENQRLKRLDLPVKRRRCPDCSERATLEARGQTTPFGGET